MFKSVDEVDTDKWEVVDLKTNKVIDKCQWANDENGEYCVYVEDEEDSIFPVRRDFKTEIKKGKIKLKRKG